MTKTQKTEATDKTAQAAQARGRKAAPQAAAPAAEKKPSKIDQVVGLLRAPDGATIAELMAATGWQAHSVRGALAGTVKKRLGYALTSEMTERGRVYRITANAEPEAAAAMPIPGDTGAESAGEAA